MVSDNHQSGQKEVGKSDEARPYHMLVHAQASNKNQFLCRLSTTTCTAKNWGTIFFGGVEVVTKSFTDKQIPRGLRAENEHV